MTATPIPRTLALSLYGDLDLSLIDELPPGRQKIATHLLDPDERRLAYEKIRREVAKGGQAFVICPLVEDSPNLEARAATAEYERLQAGDLAGLRLALLHGRMRPAEKDRVMREFRDGEHDVLVSTAVVEVGRGHPERQRDADRGRRAVRAGPAAPVSGARRAGQPAVGLPAADRGGLRDAP